MNNYSVDLFGKNSDEILREIQHIRSLSSSFRFTVSQYKRFSSAIRNAEMSLRKNSAFLNFVYKTPDFYLFIIFKSFLQTGNKLDTFEEYYTKSMGKNKQLPHGLKFFKMYKQSFEEFYKLSRYLNTAKTIVTTKFSPK